MEEPFNELIESFDPNVLMNYYNSSTKNEKETKIGIERLLKNIFKQLMTEHNNEQYTKFLDLIVFCVQKDVCKSQTLFITLSDMFDVSTLEQCEVIFSHLEDNIFIWKSEAFYKAGKNYLLRTCNDLLKRLSRSQNTIFSGRIQLFLAHLFSIEEKSGLNLTSDFNLENITTYSSLPSIPNDDEEELVDFKLYKRFWSLQDFFRNPVQCYDRSAWKVFVQNAEDVLACFNSFKLDSSRPSMLQQQTFFPKYLTNQKLLNLQLNDSNFRRYILLQHLVIFQYLTSSVKFKQAHHILTEEQSNWIKATTEKVYDLIVETPSNGEDFLNVVKHVLAREENWNKWKNECCVSFIRKEEDTHSVIKKKKRRSLGDDMNSSRKVVKMGNPELTRLWNLCPDNQKACRGSNRNFQKEPGEFLEEAIIQMDPANGIEDAYKLVNDPVFAWKAMRLLSRSSSSFFHANQSKGINTVPQYLECVMSRMEKELPSVKNNGVVESPKQENKAQVSQQTSPSSQATSDREFKDIEEFLEAVGDNWRKLGEVVGVMDGVLDDVEERAESNRKACEEVVQLWKEASGEIASDMMEEVFRLISH